MNIEKLIIEVLTVYRRDMPRLSSTPKQREWFIRAFPNLDRGQSWNRALYDFNVSNWNSPHTTGICLSLAIFLHERLNREGEESEILFLYEVNTFCHAVVKWKGKFYDSFYPKGTDNYKDLVFSDCCTLQAADQRIISQFFRSPALGLLKKDVYDKIDLEAA